MIDIECGDCFELVKNVKDKSIDFVLTDPPYEFKDGGFGGGKQELSKRKFKAELNHNENFMQKLDTDKLMTEIERVCKKVNCVIFGTEPMMLKLANYAESKKYIWSLNIWHKTNPPPFINNAYLKDIEYAIFIRERGVKMYGDYSTLSKVYESKINSEDKKIYNHPTIKPEPLIEKYIENHTREDETVLDFYLGSGTTGVVCKKMNRNFIGFEIDKNYFETANKRINNTYEQGSLF